VKVFATCVCTRDGSVETIVDCADLSGSACTNGYSDLCDEEGTTTFATGKENNFPQDTRRISAELEPLKKQVYSLRWKLKQGYGTKRTGVGHRSGILPVTIDA